MNEVTKLTIFINENLVTDLTVLQKKTLKMFRYHDTGAFCFFKLPKPFCTSKSIVNIQNTDNYCVLW